MGKNNSVFQAETLAIKMAAIHLINKNNLEKKYIKIFCDSQACLKALNNKNITSKLVDDTAYELNKLAEISR